MTIGLKRLQLIAQELKKTQTLAGRTRYSLMQIRLFMGRYGIVDKYQFKDALLYLEAVGIGKYNELEMMFHMNVEEEKKDAKTRD